MDLLIPEIISPLLCKLFNYMYDNCVYPDSWSRGIIASVPKKGDMRNVNNYRGITLTSIFSKIFSYILDGRLHRCVEGNNYLNASWYGFRENKSTVDCIFILKSIIDSTVNAGKKLFCAFIDFCEAFDLVYRNGIWFKLVSCGVSSKFVNMIWNVNMIRKMYESVKVCVRSMHKLSDLFESYVRVKQGEPLSPLLLIIFINDMANEIASGDLTACTLNQIQIFLLLFADDTVLFAETAADLQLLLDNLKVYCNKWNISVNIDKSKVVVFKSGNQRINCRLYFDNTELEFVSSFTYLGVTDIKWKIFSSSKNH